MYAIIVYSRFEKNEIDAVLGPFESSKAAHDKYYELFGHAYRHVSFQPLVEELPEWAQSNEEWPDEHV